MGRVRARVLSLPTPADAVEEAGRMGMSESETSDLLDSWEGDLVKVEWLPEAVAASIRQTVLEHNGLAFLAERPAEATAREEDHQGEPVQSSLLDAGRMPGRGFDVLLSAQRPLLLQLAAALEASASEFEREAGTELRAVLSNHREVLLGNTNCGEFVFEWGKRTYVMGIINVTPDSFSGDGIGTDLDAAVAQGIRFVEEGADILDVGGESTRPGAQPVSVEEEIRRVVPVIRRLVEEVRVPVSIDSFKLLVVQEALEAGARMINDVWGLRRTEGLASLSAAYDVPIVLMHNRRADPGQTRLGGHYQKAEYSDLMGEIVADLRESVDLALAANVKWENIILDPGVGFGKTPDQNLVVLRRMRELRSLGRPILMGTSRKSVIGLTLGVPADDRVEGTAATVAVSICNGADIVRVHDVKEMARVSRMTDAIVRVRGEVSGECEQERFRSPMTHR